MKRYFLFCAICAVMAACSTRVEQAAIATKPMSVEEAAWRSTCTKCHSLKSPKLHTALEWVDVVDKMQGQDGEQQFTDATKAQILKYLQQNASSN